MLEIDTRSAELSRPKDKHAPRTLTHAVLLQRVWGPERGRDAWLVRDIVRRLRGKLGDDADNPRYIITEPRVGYRMPMGGTAPEAPPPSPREESAEKPEQDRHHTQQ